MSSISVRYVHRDEVTHGEPELLLKATKLVRKWIPQYQRADGSFVAAHYKMVHEADDHDPAKVLAGQGTYSQKLAHKKLSGQAWWQAQPDEHKVLHVQAHATDIQHADSAKAQLAVMKKNAAAGKAPTPAQLKFYAALPEADAVAIVQALKDKGAPRDVLQALIAQHPAGAAALKAKAPPPAAPAPAPEPAPAVSQPEPAAVPAPEAPAITPESAPASAAGPAPAWDVYANTTGSHNKFWAVAVVPHADGSALVVTRYGPIGGKGQTTTKHVASLVAANAMRSTLLNQKKANGYVPSDAGAHPALAKPIEMPAPAAAAAPVASAPAAGAPALPSADGWQKVGGQLGSNAGFVAIDPAGQKWYVKTPNSEEHARSELLASKLYALAGVKAAELKAVTVGGKLSIASKWEDNTAKAAPGTHASLAGAREGFAVDAWLANWDALGVDSTNIQSVAGNASRIDVGGSLEYRAQGGLKGAAFGTSVPELATMRDPKKNAQTAAVFGGMTDADVAKSIAEHVAKVSDDDILNAVRKVGPGGGAARAALAQKLIARRQYLLGWASQHQAKPAAAPAPAPAPAAAPATPAANDFGDFAGLVGEAEEAIGKGDTDEIASIVKYLKTPMNAKDPGAKALLAHIEKLQREKGPKDGDTKQGADGMLVFKDGRWHKQEAAAPAPAFQDDEDAEAAIAAAPTKADALKLAAAYVLKQPTKEAKDSAFFNAAMSMKQGGHYATGSQAGAELSAAIGSAQAAAAAPPAPAPAPPAPAIKPLSMPEFSDGSVVPTPGKQGPAAYYESIATKIMNAAESGDIAGLVAMKQKGQAAANKTWKGKTPNSKKLLALHAEAVQLAQSVKAKASAPPPAPAPAPAPEPAPAPRAPKVVAAVPAGAPVPSGVATAQAMAAIEDAMLPPSNTNHGPVNKKLMAMHAAARKGDVDALKAMTFGSNSYAKKMVKLHAALLAAMGESAPAAAPPPLKVKGAKVKGDTSWVKLRPGEKIVDAGREFGVEWATVEVPAKGHDPDAFPPMPIFNKSSKAHVNNANAVLAAEILDEAKAGKLTAAQLKGKTFDAIAKDTGLPTGAKVSVFSHPASQINELVTQVHAELEAQQHPTQKVVHNGSLAGGYTKAMASIASKVKVVAYEKFKSWAHKAADYLVLDKAAGAILAVPPAGQFKETDGETGAMAAFKAKSNAAFHKLAAPLQQALKQYTGSAYHDWNRAMRKGELESSHWDSSQNLRKAFDEAAQELPEGIILWRGIGVGGDTYGSVVGGVIQDGSVQSCSYGDSPAFSSKETLLRIHVPAGVRAVHATAFSNFGKGEREIILDRQVRYAVVKVTKYDNFKPDGSSKSFGKKTVVDLIALPHE
jgi:predicted DNA-binding WGR domain protein